MGASVAAGALFACSSDEARHAPAPAPAPGEVRAEAPARETPARETPASETPDNGRAGVCGEGDDAVLDVLCGDAKPTSLLELRERLGLVGEDRSHLLGAIASTTSLAVRTVSEANPRVIFYGSDARSRSVYLAFARGAAVVELAAADRRTGELTFYLVRFEPRSGPDSLFLPAMESDWTNVTFARDEDLEDTASDCLGCHRPDGPGTKKRVIFREDEQPWLHWIGDKTYASSAGSCTPEDCPSRDYDPRAMRDPGVAVAEAFASVHPLDETYASVPVRELITHRYYGLHNLLEQDGLSRDAGDFFRTATVVEEVNASAPGQPFLNVPIGVSPTWDANRAASLRERAVLPFPYHDAKASDPARLADYAEKYRAIVAGEASAATLPSARELLLPEARRALLVEMEPDLSGDEVLARACSQCHNEGVRSGLRRSGFDARHPDRASRAMKDAAIARMRLPADDPSHMPPAVFRDLDDASRDAAIARLER
ncbi:MAG: hypothetical protein KF837_17245 [Labilithrix sp.]|nr:hypothetical protein [Labilithrix sp.]